jgi:hypothetical protein
MTRQQFLSKTMKAAHTIRRRDGKTMSQALKAAWAWAKKKLAIQLELAKETSITVLEVITESAKAIKAEVGLYDRESGNQMRETAQVWLPKSQIRQDGDTVYLPMWLHAEKSDAAGRSLRSHRTESYYVGIA